MNKGPVVSFSGDVVDNDFHSVLSIGSLLFSGVSLLIRIITFPARFFLNLALSFPITTCIFVLFSLSCACIAHFVIKKITSQNFVQFTLHSIFPYIVSILYTAVAIFFPQVNVVVNLARGVLHPFEWLMNLLRTIRARAEPARRIVESVFPSSPRTETEPPRVRRSSRISSSQSSIHSPAAEDLSCCVCLERQKNILLRPCNHICLCSMCLQILLDEDGEEALCPVCRSPIQSHLQVYFS